MTILIASDLHGCAPACRRLMEAYRESRAERLVLLGDILYHGPRNRLPDGYDPGEVIERLSRMAGEITCVRGNCDAEVDQMVLPFSLLRERVEIEVDGRLWVASHGHRAGYNPTAGEVPDLPAGSVLLTGHTHIPTLQTSAAGVLLLNPGSTSIPKGGYPASYALYRDGRFSVRRLADGGGIL